MVKSCENRDAEELVRDAEAQHGRLRLDLRPFDPNHADKDWTDAVSGRAFPELGRLNPLPHLQMFDGAILHRLSAAARELVSHRCQEIDQVVIGWTSIPVLNACAIRRGTSRAIALNLRLITVLSEANSLNWQLTESALAHDAEKVVLLRDRVFSLFTAASQTRLDDVMLVTDAWTTDAVARIGMALTMLQLLFVVLHEYGHICLRHLERDELWQGHPLVGGDIDFFNSSRDAEFAADSFAMAAILSIDRWGPATSYLEVFRYPFPRRVIPAQIIHFFVWLALLAPPNSPSYYAVPRTHPHPLDRAGHVIRHVANSHASFEPQRLKDILETAVALLHRE